MYVYLGMYIYIYTHTLRLGISDVCFGGSTLAKNSKVERLANIFERSAGADVAGEPMQLRV